MSVVKTDVLVVGGGGAGLRAAIEASRQAVKTVLVSKGRPARSGVTPLAGADLALDGKSLHELGFPGDPTDSKEKFFRDIVIQGFYLNNQKLVEAYVRDAPARVKELIDWGMKVSASESRAVLTSGVEITDALNRELKRSNVEIFEDIMVYELLTRGGKVVGALGIDINSGEFIVFNSKAVVLATGGWHKAYYLNSGTPDMSGDGQAMAFKVGAELINMEMITFCPNVIVWPPSLRGSIYLYVFHLFCGNILNSLGENFMEKYPKRIAEVGTRTEWNKLILSIASMREILEGRGGPHGGVYFSLKGIPWEDVEKSGILSFAPNWKFQGTDFSGLTQKLREGEMVEVAPAAHYFEGGIKINEKCETGIAGLYAAGECAAGLFGANRVAAATTEMLIQGAIAGKYAAEYAKRVNFTDFDEKQVERFKEEALGPIKRREGVKLFELKERLQRLAYDKVGVIRTAQDLSEAINEISSIRKEKLPKLCTTTKVTEYNREWIECLELKNMFLLVEISARAALLRTESRGVHYRSDYPYMDNNNWLKELAAKNVNGEIVITSQPITVTTLKPPGGVMPFEESILKAIEALETVGW